VSIPKQSYEANSISLSWCGWIPAMGVAFSVNSRMKNIGGPNATNIIILFMVTFTHRYPPTKFFLGEVVDF
jgi:hypothetical protein